MERPPGSCTSDRSAPSKVAASVYVCAGAGQNMNSDLDLAPVPLPECTSMPQRSKCCIIGPVCASASAREQKGTAVSSA